jgi:hypothetical protein
LKKQFYSNGKLLITGEYVVLDGATALAIPTKMGQSLLVAEVAGNTLQWESLDENGDCWFEATFSPELVLISTSHDETAASLLKILKTAQQLNPEFLSEKRGLKATTKLDFPRNWGLGSSSTLINNIAQWAEIDAFALLAESFGGSGYDIAAAQHNLPVLYTRTKGKPIVKTVDFAWEFKDQLFFVHLNQKQNSKVAITRYKKTVQGKHLPISTFSSITEKVVSCKTLPQLLALLAEHEALLSAIIEMPTVKKRLFPDYPGLVKSLGAWGGDFVLASGEKESYTYFRKKGYHTIIPFAEMMV